MSCKIIYPYIYIFMDICGQLELPCLTNVIHSYVNCCLPRHWSFICSFRNVPCVSSWLAAVSKHALPSSISLYKPITKEKVDKKTAMHRQDCKPHVGYNKNDHPFQPPLICFVMYLLLAFSSKNSTHTPNKEVTIGFVAEKQQHNAFSLQKTNSQVSKTH